MERLKKLIQDLRAQPGPVTDEAVLNLAREYLQVLVLKFIFQDKAGAALSFMGGTCLRICYNLKRYSEDLDFCRDDAGVPCDFSALIRQICLTLTQLGFDVAGTTHDEKTVQKAFIRFGGLPEELNIRSLRKDQKLHIKIEIDTRPPKIAKGDRESFFVNRFQEIFPILKHDLPTLFAGKLLAILQRPYARGRDYYDLIWYLSRRTPVNLRYLNRGLKECKFKNVDAVFAAVDEKVRTVKPEIILKDIGRFLEDPHEANWISQYQKLYRQLVAAK